MKKMIVSAALLCSMVIGSQAANEVDAVTSATEQTEQTEQKKQEVAVAVDTVQAKADLEKYYEKEPSYDKTKENGKKTGKAFKKAAKATKRKIVNGEENTGAGEATKEAFKATGQTVVEATKTTGRYIKKQTPVVCDSIKTKGNRVKEKIKNW